MLLEASLYFTESHYGATAMKTEWDQYKDKTCCPNETL